jgi:hypothetical protein
MIFLMGFGQVPVNISQVLVNISGRKMVKISIKNPKKSSMIWKIKRK